MYFCDMAEELNINKTLSKQELYEEAIPQIKALIGTEENLVANLANITAALKQFFGHFWIGFYLVDSDDELVLGPFQGPIACTRIKKGKGVCGATWEREKTIIVPDVDKFPGHIACSGDSKSEIVVPLFDEKGNCKGVLDIDADYYEAFDELDQKFLEELMSAIKW